MPAMPVLSCLAEFLAPAPWGRGRDKITYDNKRYRKLNLTLSRRGVIILLSQEPGDYHKTINFTNQKAPPHLGVSDKKRGKLPIFRGGILGHATKGF